MSDGVGVDNRVQQFLRYVQATARSSRGEFDPEAIPMLLAALHELKLVDEVEAYVWKRWIDQD